jgi:omega-hydroxy-beta-dihydromenaquinone-9 sulfotransferase
MTWRDTFLRWFGPGMLGGITFGDWFRVLRDNHFDVSPRQLIRAMAITAQSAQNSVMRRIEDWRYGAVVRDAEILSPVFVLGHWRSGTTHLHNLLTVDKRFAFPNNYEALFPHAMLSMERVQSPFIQWFLSPRRPMDNVEWTMRSPQEDEFALCVMTFMSPCMGWFFPKRRDHYDRYLTFRGVDEREVKQWQSAMLAYFGRLSCKYKLPLVLKSPPHTGRIRRLLEIFPGAKFVHVHRDPNAVFSSTRKMLTVNFSLHCLQRPPAAEELDEWIIRQYRAMHDAFFEDRNLIPSGHYHELSFEKLEADPIGEMQRVYEALSLPDFCYVRPALERYVDSARGYQKNAFPELPVALQRRIADAWSPCFEQWGYPPGPALRELLGAAGSGFGLGPAAAR